jgi:hypothetical protein
MAAVVEDWYTGTGLAVQIIVTWSPGWRSLVNEEVAIGLYS